ncbi:MAG: DMT family transporter [Bacteroidetes bacterium]|nr:DMT family transporter [Bacteroidota bacterium]
MHHIGEFAALLTAVFWTVTAITFEAASRKIGSMVVNILRLIIGFIFLTIFVFFYRGYLFPVDASLHNWLWLSLSGLIGFTFGDLCLFQSFVLIGARVSMLIMALAPPMTALFAWMVLGEKLSLQSWIGMAVTMNGIALVVLRRSVEGEKSGLLNILKFSYPLWGLLLAFGGAVGQSVGLVLSKVGMQGYDTFASTQIRVMAGTAGFAVIYSFMGKWKDVFRGTTRPRPMAILSIGAFFGPFLGVSFSLIAIKYADTGIASTIMAIVPVLIIAPSMILYKEKISLKEIIGALLAVGGVAIFFL